VRELLKNIGSDHPGCDRVSWVICFRCFEEPWLFQCSRFKNNSAFQYEDSTI